jgi:CTP synthase (UTP-ammonia lyase)
VIVPLECTLVGHEGVIRYTPDTLIARIAGVDQRLERYHCSYGIAPAFVAALEQAGVVFGAHDEDGAPRALELPGRPFFLGTLFQPELAGDGTRAHPVIRAFAEAVVSRRARGRDTRAAQPA